MFQAKQPQNLLPACLQKLQIFQVELEQSNVVSNSELFQDQVYVILTEMSFADRMEVPQLWTSAMLWIQEASRRLSPLVSSQISKLHQQ